MKIELLQTGIYTVSEASRLANVSPWRIRRWLKGYEFKVKHGRHRSPSVWNSQLDPIDQILARSVRANDSVEEVARWFEISSKSVREAIDFEDALAA